MWTRPGLDEVSRLSLRHHLDELRERLLPTRSIRYSVLNALERKLAADTAWMEKQSAAAAVAAAVAVVEEVYSSKSPQSMSNPYDSVEPYSFSAVAFFYRFPFFPLDPERRADDS